MKSQIYFIAILCYHIPDKSWVNYSFNSNTLKEINAEFQILLLSKLFCITHMLRGDSFPILDFLLSRCVYSFCPCTNSCQESNWVWDFCTVIPNGANLIQCVGSSFLSLINDGVAVLVAPGKYSIALCSNSKMALLGIYFNGLLPKKEQASLKTSNLRQIIQTKNYPVLKRDDSPVQHHCSFVICK